MLCTCFCAIHLCGKTHKFLFRAALMHIFFHLCMKNVCLPEYAALHKKSAPYQGLSERGIRYVHLSIRNRLIRGIWTSRNAMAKKLEAVLANCYRKTVGITSSKKFNHPFTVTYLALNHIRLKLRCWDGKSFCSY